MVKSYITLLKSIYKLAIYRKLYRHIIVMNVRFFGDISLQIMYNFSLFCNNFDDRLHNYATLSNIIYAPLSPKLNRPLVLHSVAKLYLAFGDNLTLAIILR